MRDLLLPVDADLATSSFREEWSTTNERSTSGELAAPGSRIIVVAVGSERKKVGGAMPSHRLSDRGRSR